MSIFAADKKAKARELAVFFRQAADFKAKVLNLDVQDGSEFRDGAADRMAELAELIADMDFR